MHTHDGCRLPRAFSGCERVAPTPRAEETRPPSHARMHVYTACEQLRCDCYGLALTFPTAVTGSGAARAHHVGEVAPRHEHARGGGAYGRGRRSTRAGLHAMLHHLRCTGDAHHRRCTDRHSCTYTCTHRRHSPPRRARRPTSCAASPRSSTPTRRCSCAYARARAPMHTHTHVHMYMCMCMSTWKYTCTLRWTRTCACTCPCACYAHVHVHMHVLTSQLDAEA